MASRDTVNFAVVGLGIGQSHIRAITSDPGAKLVAICSTDEPVLRETAAKTGAATYTDYNEMFKRPDIDVVCVCTPSGLHAQVGMAAAKAGKNVLCEKPLDVTLEKADALIDTCKQAGVKLGAVFQNRFHPLNQKIRETITSGKLGKVLYADAHLYWYRADAYYAGGDPNRWRGTWRFDGGGAFMNQGIHNIDLIQWLVGPVKSVIAKAGTFAHKIETEDVGTAILTFENGALGNLTCTTCAYPGLSNDLHIIGENGSIAVSDHKLIAWKMKGASREAEAAEEQKMLEAYTATGPNPAFDPRIVSGHGAHIRDMIQAVRGNKSPDLTGDEARKGLALGIAIVASYRSGGKETMVNRRS